MTVEKILEVKELTKFFDISGGTNGKKANVYAVDNVSFDLYKSETLGVVGESGSGKSTLARVILKLLKANSGKVIYGDKDIVDLKGKDLNNIRRDLQIVFQDPYSSLNPRFNIGYAIAEPLLVHKIVSDKNEARNRVYELLELVGLPPEAYDRYPHEFSGGQRQRIGIARALAMEPKVLICDEAVSALDVSVQAQILNLFNQLKKRLGLTYIFISHDLSVVKYLSDRIMVMYLGEVVEMAPTERLFENPLHPYTQNLISSIPDISKRGNKNKIGQEKSTPTPFNLTSGFSFAARSTNTAVKGEKEASELIEVERGHLVRCLSHRKI